MIYDLSYYQQGLKIASLEECEGVILRAGWGMDVESQDDKSCEEFVNQCRENNIPFGLYLFSYAIDGDGHTFEEHKASEIAHMKRLESKYNPLLGCWLDIENEANYKEKNGWRDENHAEELNSYVNEWLETFKGGIYCDRSHTGYLNIPKDKLWIATLDNTIIDDCVMCQYSSSDNLDKNVRGNHYDNCLITSNIEIAGVEDVAEDIPMTDAELAVKVFNGEFGDGDDRKNTLGSRYEAVQEIVNLSDAARKGSYTDKVLADLVYEGKFGDGDTRKYLLGGRYEGVQNVINGVNSNIVYTVVSGDTLSAIAQRFNTTVSAIAEKNNIENVNLIYAGQQLNI